MALATGRHCSGAVQNIISMREGGTGRELLSCVLHHSRNHEGGAGLTLSSTVRHLQCNQHRQRKSTINAGGRGVNVSRSYSCVMLYWPAQARTRAAPGPRSAPSSSQRLPRTAPRTGWSTASPTPGRATTGESGALQTNYVFFLTFCLSECVSRYQLLVGDRIYLFYGWNRGSQPSRGEPIPRTDMQLDEVKLSNK